jgi:hypothetical protein
MQLELLENFEYPVCWRLTLVYKTEITAIGDAPH